MNALHKHFLLFCLPLYALMSGLAVAETAHDPLTVLAYQGEVVLEQQELDAAVSKLAPEDRLVFLRDGAKVDQLIRALLRRKVIAAAAVREGFDQDPLIAAKMGLEAEKVLAEDWLQKVVADMPAADYEALAYEDYLANPDRYRSPETLDVSHILIEADDCASETARLLAAQLVDELEQDPSKFDAMVKEYSDDPAKDENGGRYAEMRRGMMVKPFEDAAFALTEPGTIAGPVRTDYGWHIIRLNARWGDERQEFSEVKEVAVEQAENQYRKNYRENYLRKLLSGPIVIPDEAVEVMAKRHFGENLELAPDNRK